MTATLGASGLVPHTETPAPACLQAEPERVTERQHVLNDKHATRVKFTVFTVDAASTMNREGTGRPGLGVARLPWAALGRAAR